MQFVHFVFSACTGVYRREILQAMPNQRDKSKKLVTLWVTEDEKQQLKEASKRYGFESVTEFIKAVASGTVKVSPHIKALALAAVGSQQDWCGLLLGLLIMLAFTAYALS